MNDSESDSSPTSTSTSTTPTCIQRSGGWRGGKSKNSSERESEILFTARHSLSFQVLRKSFETKYMWLFRIIIETKVTECFSNVETALRLFLSLMVTNCSGERSFSVLKRVKSYLRSTSQQCRNHVSLHYPF